MNAPLGYALLRDRRVSIQSKLTALGVGVAVMGFVELLQIPFESVFALLLPVVGAAGDIAIDGAEAVIIPVLVATILLPHLAPPSVVQQLRAERAAGSPDDDTPSREIEAERVPVQEKERDTGRER